MRTRNPVPIGLAALAVMLVGIALVLAAGSASSDSPKTGSPTAGSPSTGAPTTASTTSGSPTSGSTTTASTTTASPTTASPTTGPPTTASPTTGPTTTGNATNRPSAEPIPGVERQVVGPLPQGGGLLVRLVQPDDGECVVGTLVVETGGTVTHTYDRNYAHLRLYAGPYGQAAMVEQCEESTGELFFTGTATLPEGEPPQWLAVPVPLDVAHLGEFGWFGLTGFFAAEATFHTGGTTWVDTVVFDAFDGSMHLWADKLGFRDSHPLLGVDFVVPHNWNYAPLDDDTWTIDLWDIESTSWVTITVSTDPPRLPTPTGDETLVDTSVVAIDLWDDRGLGRATPDGVADAVDYRFVGSEGVRSVRLVALAGRVIEIESFLSAGAGQAGGEVPAMVVEAVRIFTAVG